MSKKISTHKHIHNIGFVGLMMVAPQCDIIFPLTGDRASESAGIYTFILYYISEIFTANLVERNPNKNM